MNDGINPNPDFRPNEIHVRVVNGDDSVCLSFQLLTEIHTMNRPFNENLERTLQRFSITCRNKLKKESKKAKGKRSKNARTINSCESSTQNPDSSSRPSLRFEGTACDVAKMFNCELKTGMEIELDDLTYFVVRNAPTICSISAFPKSLVYAGCPVIPQVTMEFAHDYECTWACERGPRSNDYVVVGNDKLFTPTSAMVGCRIKVYAVAIRPSMPDMFGDESCTSGRWAVFYLSGLVQPFASSATQLFNSMLNFRAEFNHIKRYHASTSTAGSSMGSGKWQTGFHLIDGLEQFPIAEGNSKSAATSIRERNELRVMTYNVLAETFATSEQALNFLYPYCNSDFLQTEFRIQRVLAELQASRADIIAIQESDIKTFQSYLLPAMGRMGYDGHFTHKGATEGCAIFTNSQAVRVVQRIDLSLKNVLRDAPYLSGVYERRPDLRDIIGGKLGTVAQLTILESTCVTRTYFVVANTHLFYHPLACYIRLLQVYAITRALESIKQQIEQSFLEGGGGGGGGGGGSERCAYTQVHIDGQDAPNPIREALEAQLAATLRQPVSATTTTTTATTTTAATGEDTGSQQQQQQQSSADAHRNTSGEEDVSSSKSSSKSRRRSGGYSHHHNEGEGQTGADVRVHCMLLGDLNSDPAIAAIRFLTEGCISLEAVQEVWTSLDKFRWGARDTSTTSTNSSNQTNNTRKVSSDAAKEKMARGPDPDEAAASHTQGDKTTVKDSIHATGVVGVNPSVGATDIGKTSKIDEESKPDPVIGIQPLLTHGLDFFSAAGYPTYSNYTPGFKDLLDYIMVSKHSFEVLRVAPCPDEDVLSAAVGLPSAVFPSDHISIMVDMRILPAPAPAPAPVHHSPGATSD